MNNVHCVIVIRAEGEGISLVHEPFHSPKPMQPCNKQTNLNLTFSPSSCRHCLVRQPPTSCRAIHPQLIKSDEGTHTPPLLCGAQLISHCTPPLQCGAQLRSHCIPPLQCGAQLMSVISVLIAVWGTADTTLHTTIVM